MTSRCCVTGQILQDHMYENLTVRKQLTSCDSATRTLCALDATIVNGVADTFVINTLEVTNLTVTNNFTSNLPQSIFFNGSTLANPGYILLPTIEVSETSNGLAPAFWPTAFPGGLLGYSYNGFGQVLINSGAANVGNYIRWDNINFPTAGTYSLRCYTTSTAQSGIFQATVDGVPTGTTNDLSVGGIRLSLFDNIVISPGTHNIGIQCIGTNSADFAGQFLAEIFLLVQTA